MTYTNKHNIPLPLQIWLATDNYEHDADDRVISATTLLKSTRQIVLGRRYKESEKVVDIADLSSMVMGTSIHAGVEKALEPSNAINVLEKLGYKNGSEIMSQMVVEKRTKKEIDGFVISGQFDMAYKGIVCDIKSTSTWKYILGDGKDYIKQLSIYKWLNPEIITSNKAYIFYIFTDWSSVKAMSDTQYPQSRIAYKEYMLDENIETWIRKKLADINACSVLSDEQLPLCSDEELWREPDKYAWYKDPSKRTRATKVFEDKAEAYAQAGGVVVERKGSVKACKYCSYINYCNQYTDLVLSGDIKDER